MKLEEKLNEELRGTIEAAKARKYYPTYFNQMLDLYGGIETAKRLLADSKPQTGLFELHRLGLLQDSMEAVILKKEYKEFFTNNELAEAHKRLDDLGYFDD